MDDGCAMTARDQGLSHPLHVDAVAAEIERRVERREKAETQSGQSSTVH
jgi:hypothetical protein